MITPEREAEVLRLHHAEKWPIGTIANQLGLHHSTVRRMLSQAGIVAGRSMARPSIVDDFVPFIVQTLTKYPRLRASRLFAMARERGFTGSQDYFRHVVSRYRPRPVAEAYQRLRTLPGEQGQVDWAHFGKLTVGNAIRPLWAFVMVLSYSRKVFLRYYFGSAMPAFLHGHVSAFTYFGGVPRELLYDNLKSAVLERSGDAVRFNPTLLELSAYYRFLPKPVAPARGNAYDVIILDDLGYVQQSAEEVEVLFTLMAERYARRSMIITSNLVFGEWDRIFKNPMTTAAAIDRLVHHSVILEFNGPSIRAEEAKKRNPKPPPQPSP